MIAALLALAAQDAAPTMPAGTSPEVLGTAMRVQRALEAGEFETAARLAARLPRREIAVVWDDSAVPEDRRAAFRAAFDAAVEEWASAVPEVKVVRAAKGAAKVSFVPRLPPPPDGFRPAGSVHFYSEDPGEPVVEAVLALQREEPPQPAERTDVRNDVCRMIGACLGLAESPRAFAVMGRLDTLTTVPTRVGPAERQAVLAILEASDALRKAAGSRTRMLASLPEASVRQADFEAPPVLQGVRLSFEVEVTNTGTAPLRIEGVPDCGCFTLRYQPELAPGQSSLVQVFVDTSEVPGAFDKRVLLRTNDPERPEIACRFRSHVRPVYRVLRREGSRPVYLDGGRGEAEVFLLHQPDRPFRVLGATVTGVKGTVEASPWTGTLADPAYGEPESPRVGYRLRITLEGSPAGRVQASLQVKTDDPDYPVVLANVPVQSGIAAVPASLYLGNLARTPRRAAFLVSRPGQAFRVTGVKPSSPHLRAEALPYRDAGDFRVVVEVLPSAPSGNFEAEVVVSTDDPAQPTIRVPVTALVP